MQDELDKLASGVKVIVTEACAKTADLHRISRPENEWQRGYNQAVADISGKIRELKK